MKARTSICLLMLVGLWGCGQDSAPRGPEPVPANTTPAPPEQSAGAELRRAAERSDLGAVQSQLAAGADVNSQSESGVTALMIAAGMGNVELARVLIEKGANVNLKTPGGYTPLMSAALNGQTDIVKLLIEKGADVNAVDVGGQTALKYADSKGHQEIVALLKKAGAKE